MPAFTKKWILVNVTQFLSDESPLTHYRNLCLCVTETAEDYYPSVEYEVEYNS